MKKSYAFVDVHVTDEGETRNSLDAYLLCSDTAN